MKNLFRDALQQVMESELDTELGYEKSERMLGNDDAVCRKITVMDIRKKWSKHSLES